MAYFSSHGCLLQPLLMVTTITVVATTAPNKHLYYSRQQPLPPHSHRCHHQHQQSGHHNSRCHKFSSANPMVLPCIPVPYHFMSDHRRGGKHNQLSPRDHSSMLFPSTNFSQPFVLNIFLINYS